VLEVADAQTTFALTNAAYQDGAVRYRVALASCNSYGGADDSMKITMRLTCKRKNFRWSPSRRLARCSSA